MLEPDGRALLSELLRPPPGFRLAQAVGTTFTLDLASALVVPLAFARHDLDPGEDATESLGVFDAVRRAADRVDVFAQAGCLSLSGARAPAAGLLAMLEPMVHPIAMPSGLFHPKVWFLEYASRDADGRDGAERRYRFVCSSRNLTSDHSWDAAVCLDGMPDAATPHRVQNGRMRELLRWLAGSTTPALSTRRQQRIRGLGDRWRSIRWQLPPDVRHLDVHVLGLGIQPGDDRRTIGASTLDRGRRTQRLIVSPFISDDGLRTIGTGVQATHVISRPDEIDRLSADTRRRLTTWVLAPDAEIATAVDDADRVGGAAASAASAADSPASALHGLHAKVIVTDYDRRSRLVLGSANATSQAWHRNVEVMVELEGSTKTLGVAATLGSLGAGEDEPFVVPYAAGSPEESAEEREAEEARERLERTLRSVAGRNVTLSAEAEPDGESATVRVWSEDGAPTSSSVRLRWRLLGGERAPSGTGWPPPAEAPSTHAAVPLDDITPFVEVTASDEGISVSSIVVARIERDVAERRGRLVARMLDSTDRFLAFLALVLQDDPSVLPSPGGRDRQGRFGLFAGVDDEGNGLFEALMRVAGRDDDAMRTVHRALAHVEATVIPSGFAELWEATWDAHAAAMRRQR